MSEKNAVTYALWLLEKRDYSEHDLFAKISDKYEETEAAAAVARMVELGYVDDGKYARRLASKYLSQYGKKRAADELYRKGLDREIISEALDDVYNKDESVEKIVALIRKKTDNSFPEDRKERDKLFAFLFRKGFSSGEITEALYRLKEELLDGELTE